MIGTYTEIVRNKLYWGDRMNGLVAETNLIKVKKKGGIIKKFFNDVRQNKMLLLLTLPMVLFLFVFNYIPMFGIIVAFKKFNYVKGLFGSEWVGFANFKILFSSPDAWRITRNTLAYNSVFIITTTVAAVVLALMLFEIKNRICLKAYQTFMFLPHYLSWVVVAYMAYAFLNTRSGILNGFLHSIGMESIDWYAKPAAWIVFFPIAHLWKGIGMSVLIYYASLIGIDSTYFEAASLEGANKWQITTKITIPFLYPLITMLTILSVGSIFNADFGLFYQLPMNSPMLYETTDVIETFVFRALREQGNIDISSAAGLYKSFVGFVLVIVTNAIVRKYQSDNALF